jgi:hypothetical protein
MRGLQRIQEAMRRLALGGLLLLGGAACSPNGVRVDPACPPFDQMSCVTTNLVVQMEARESGPTAALHAISSHDGYSWSQAGVRGSIDWRLPDGTRLDKKRTVSTATFERTPDRVAPWIQISVESDAERVSIHIVRTGEGDPGSGPEAFRIRMDESGFAEVVRLDRGVSVLRVQTHWHQGQVEFFFTVRRVPA